ncbi:hypothetical protein C8R44DRAFT_895684 [Mycena epipterygia]|nr:hypothetical protein C8R44DRAFT_895684 [Mycena epipterygia]
MFTDEHNSSSESFLEKFPEPHFVSDDGHRSMWALAKALLAKVLASWFWLLANALLTSSLGIALIFFVGLRVPIAWDLSQLGQQHVGITNVVVTGLTTLCTTQLKYTVELAASHYAAMALHRGITLYQWDCLEALSTTKVFATLSSRHKWEEAVSVEVVWVLIIGTMVAHEEAPPYVGTDLAC